MLKNTLPRLKRGRVKKSQINCKFFIEFTRKIIGRNAILNVKTEEHHVAVLDDVVFAFGVDLALFLAGVKTAEFH